MSLRFSPRTVWTPVPTSPTLFWDICLPRSLFLWVKEARAEPEVSCNYGHWSASHHVHVYSAEFRGHLRSEVIWGQRSMPLPEAKGESILEVASLWSEAWIPQENTFLFRAFWRSFLTRSHIWVPGCGASGISRQYPNKWAVRKLKAESHCLCDRIAGTSQGYISFLSAMEIQVCGASSVGLDPIQTDGGGPSSMSI